MLLLTQNEVIYHLYKLGFRPSYWIWVDHEEEFPNFDVGDSSNCGVGVETSE